MIAAIISLSIAMLLFALAGEARSELLRVWGTVAAIWMTIVAALNGWIAARK